MKISLMSIAFRDLYRKGEMDVSDFIRICAQLGLDGVEITGVDEVDASISCRDDSSKPILPAKLYVSWVLLLSVKGEAYEQRAWHAVFERIASMNVLKASILCAKRHRIYRPWRSEDKWVLIYVLPPAVST